jgi:hypothetical protein
MKLKSLLFVLGAMAVLSAGPKTPLCVAKIPSIEESTTYHGY